MAENPAYSCVPEQRIIFHHGCWKRKKKGECAYRVQYKLKVPFEKQQKLCLRSAFLISISPSDKDFESRCFITENTRNP